MRPVAFAVVALASAMLLTAPRAEAEKRVFNVIGSPGTAQGEFLAPRGVAVNEGTDEVYVVDNAIDRVQRFDEDGAFVSAFGSSGGAPGQLSGPQGIAIDQDDSSVYVVDAGNSRVQKFAADGTFVDEFGSPGSGDGQLSAPNGIAVDPGTGDVYVVDSNNARVQRFSSTGAYEAQLGGPGGGDGQFSGPSQVAVDSTGDVFVLEPFGRVQRFDSTGTFEEVFAPAELALAPLGLAVDSSNDNLYVVQFLPTFDGTQVTELTSAGAFVDNHSNGGIHPDPNFADVNVGLAANPESGHIYNSISAHQIVLVLDEVLSPIATIDPITTFGAHSATFTGAVDPKGSQTAYRFEYSTDGATWTPGPQPDGSAGKGDGEVPVSVEVDGLEANTAYQVRLVATKPFGAGEDTTDPVDFATPPAPPSVRTLGAGSRTDTAAWLGGTVNPHNSPTTYYIEYGPTTTYGSRVPLSEDADAGAGTEPIVVTQLITGLAPDTTYHYRVVANNDGGQATGADRTFTTRPALPPPPPGRGYELVSLFEKNGGDISSHSDSWGLARAAAAGGAVTYNNQIAAGGQASGGYASQYLSRRGRNGWTTEGINPPFDATAGNIPQGPEYVWFTEDLSRAMTRSIFAAGAPDPATPFNLFLRDNDTGGLRAVTDPSVTLPVQPTDEANWAVFGGGSGDLGHIVFQDVRPLTPDAPPEGSVGGQAQRSLYEWVGGTLRLVSILPNGDPLLGTADPGSFQGGRVAGRHPGDHAVSQDGSRVVFGDALSGRLFVRENGTVTREVSAPEGGSGESRGTFELARASDGSVIFFQSTQELTADATASLGRPDLYRWDAAAPAGNRLTDVTTADPSGAGVLGTVGADDAATSVYFVATGALTSEARAGRPNLYLWREQSGVRHIATLAEDDDAIWSKNRAAGGIGGAHYRDARVTTDGSRLLFASRARLTAFDNAGHRQLYLYDSREDRVRCVSCSPFDAQSGGDVSLYTPESSETKPEPFLPRNLSASGERVFFDTPEALVRRDSNGKPDVYVWERGEVELISTGQSDDDSTFVDASADGSDVFFTTRQRLVGADQDGLVDLYDARVGGGFPEQQLPRECLGEECQGPPSARPLVAPPGSATFSGAGNVKPAKAKKAKSCKRGKVRKRVRTKRGKTVVRCVARPCRRAARGQRVMSQADERGRPCIKRCRRGTAGRRVTVKADKSRTRCVKRSVVHRKRRYAGRTSR